MILVLGGAGYIGSHANKLLAKKGYKTLVYDNLVYGHKESVKWGKFILGDLRDIEQLKSIFRNNKIEAVMHFAAFAYVEESVKQPEKYYINNVVNTLNILQVMREFSCKYFIFSSTCSTYGNPEYLPIDEKHLQNPINPYGQSKLIIEKILNDYSKAYDFKYVSLRYFNVAGADIDCEIGENHDPETHLVPLILDVAIGKKESIKVFGADYDTTDGSAIRDYIHVTDIADAHVLALEYLKKNKKSEIFNLGNGEGYSVFEVIEKAKEITNKNIKTIIVKARAGDPTKLISNSTKARNFLGWKPKLYKLEQILETAWKWHLKKESIF